MRAGFVAGVLLVAACGPLPEVPIRPAWIEQPSPETLDRAYPIAAARERISGEAILRCRVTAFETLSDCTVVSETPAGARFGEAALGVTSYYRMKPLSLNGAPVSGHVVEFRVLFTPVPITALGGGGGRWTPPFVDHPVWLRVAGPDNIARYYPDRAQRLGVSGRVLLTCVVGVVGTLRDCSVTTETPRDQDFGDAALRAAHHFRLKSVSPEGRSLEGDLVRVPIAFERPDAASE